MFSIKEQKGLFVLVILIAITLLSKYLSKENIPFEPNNIDTTGKIDIVSITPYLEINTQDTIVKSKRMFNNSASPLKRQQNKAGKTIKAFDFNPNTISYDSLILLGLNKRTAYNWIKYISKGGKFKIKNDIKKIYGLKEKKFLSIKNHILLPDSIKKTKYIASDKSPVKKHHPQENIMIDLNVCTAEELKKLNGIGEKLSARIIKFRNKIGGFYSVNQLKEVYGLPLETFNRIKGNLIADKNKIRKIKINIEEKKSLIRFPYFNYRLAIQLYNYRKQHGYFKGIDDIKKIKTIDNTKIQKIEPYLDFALN